MKLLVSFIRPYWKLCVAVLLLASINQIFSLLDPYIFRHVIDRYATQFGAYTFSEFLRGVSFLLSLAVGAAFVSRVAKNFQDYVLNTIIQKVGTDMYTTGVEHSLHVPYSVFEDQRSGETLNILQKVRTDTEKLIIAAVSVFFVAMIGFLYVTVYAAFIYWPIAAVYASTVPLIGTVSYFLTKKVKNIQTSIVTETSALAGSTTESLRNIELVKSLGLTQSEIARLNTTTEKILSLELKKLRYIRSISFIQGTIINLLRTSILLFMMVLIYMNIITFGQFFSLFVYSFFVFGPLQEIGTVVSVYREAESSLKRFADLLAIPKEKVPEKTVPVQKLEELAFDDVSFVYNSGQSHALSHISFGLQAGETIAFVGPSGSGKTSLVKLLVGLYAPTSGSITYNQIDRDTIDLNSLREQIGFVTQDTQLFAGTIRENLLFVKKDATDADMIQALQKSAAQSLLDRSSMGLDTCIGEGGMKISGGEKQRLSIARALLRNPSLLIFDEATSALDSLTEEEITKTIQQLHGSGEHATVLIAHRLSTVMHADRIYVLEKGNLVETGSHEDLLARGGLYAAMWRQQIGERV